MQLTIPISECQDAIRFPAGMLRWSEEEFFHFCQANRDLRIERSPNGEIIVMSPAGGYASFQNGVWGATEQKTGLSVVIGGVSPPQWS